jgi:excisionase family DNA binding protein
MTGTEQIETVSGSGRTAMFLKPAEVTDMLRISRPTLNRWVAAGRLRRFKIGQRTVRYDVEEVIALLEASTLPQTRDGRPARTPIVTHNATKQVGAV